MHKKGSSSWNGDILQREIDICTAGYETKKSQRTKMGKCIHTSRFVDCQHSLLVVRKERKYSLCNIQRFEWVYCTNEMGFSSSVISSPFKHMLICYPPIFLCFKSEKVFSKVLRLSLLNYIITIYDDHHNRPYFCVRRSKCTRSPHTHTLGRTSHAYISYTALLSLFPSTHLFTKGKTSSEGHTYNTYITQPDYFSRPSFVRLFMLNGL